LIAAALEIAEASLNATDTESSLLDDAEIETPSIEMSAAARALVITAVDITSATAPITDEVAALIEKSRI
jgi:hypothetical protein